MLTWFLDGYHRDRYPGLTHGAVKNMLEELGINPVPTCDRTSEMANIARKMFPVVSCSEKMMGSYAGDLYEIKCTVRTQSNMGKKQSMSIYPTQFVCDCVRSRSRLFLSLGYDGAA